MIDGLKPYPEYKDSGVPWLGKIPLRWDVRRMKLLLREVDSRSANGKEQLLRVSQYTGVTQRKSNDGSDAPDTRASSLVGYKRVAVDDLVINIMLAWNGSMGISRYDGIASPAYCVYRLKSGAQPWYYHELLRLPLYKGRIKAVSTGVIESRLRLYSDDLGRIEAIQPPLDEQDAIVRFLDHANGRIERYLRAKKRELTLVSEMLQNVTQHAMQLPGAKNLRLSVAAEAMSRPVKRQAGHSYTPIGLYNRGRGIFHKPNTDGAHLGDSDFAWVEDGDLVISGQFAWEGAVALARAKDAGCVASHRYPILRGRREYATSAVLLALLRTPYGAMLLDQHSRGAAGRNRPLNARTFLKEKIPIPPLSAQARITDLLDQEYSVTQSLAKAVRFVNEYRTRLVADVVTGKLDVRAAARQLPAAGGELSDGADQSDGLDESDLSGETALE